MLLLGVLQAQAAGGVAAGSFDLLETQVLTSSQASVTFSSLSTYAADYQHLQIRWAARSDRSGAPMDNLSIRLNGDTGVNYYMHALQGDGSSVTSEGQGRDEIIFGRAAASTAPTDAFGAGVIDILDSFESTKNTTIRQLSGLLGSSENYVTLSSGLWNNTAALSSILIFPLVGSNWVTGSRFSLYGIRGS